MGKLFGKKRKRPVERTGEDWDQTYDDYDIEGEEYYAEDGDYTEEEYYAEDGEYTEEEYYAEDGEYTEEEYYAEEGEYTEDEYYAEDGEYAEEGDTAEEGEYTEDEYYAEDGEYAEEEYYAEDGDYTEEEYYAVGGEFRGEILYTEGEEAHDDSPEEEADIYYHEDQSYLPPRHKRGFWARYMEMSALDRIVMAGGAAILVLALVTGIAFAGVKFASNKQEAFHTVGKQLDGINVIGESGLLAVADATQARIAAARELEAQQKQAEEANAQYQEAEYSKEVVVNLNFTSIQKDLKIKFVNQKTGKLIPNVPFRVSVTDAGGKTSVWTDDDMDGIIYKKGLTGGTYKVAAETLEGEKYKGFSLPSAAETVEVKKDIAYKQVDVSNEIKSESEINVAKEDTRKQETVVESRLTDTVAWVASSTNGAIVYTEVPKNTIPDPLTLAFAGSFLRTAKTGTTDPASKAIKVGESFTITASAGRATLESITWKTSSQSVASVDGSGKVTGVGPGNAVISFEAVVKTVSGGDTLWEPVTGSCQVTVSETLGKGNIALSAAAATLSVKSTASVKATVSGFAAGKELAYQVSGFQAEIASAAVDANGTITITGIKEGDTSVVLTVNYKQGGSAETAATATIPVKVVGSRAVTLDKTTATAYVGTPLNLTATLTNALTAGTLSAESSDKNIATVAVNGKTIVVTGVKAGSVTITVKYVENAEEVKTVATVTVKTNPKEDKTSKLKDASGNQLYVLEGTVYREAVYADYYTADKFFIKGEGKYTGWQTIDGAVYYFTAEGKKVTGEQVIQGAKYNFASDGSLVTGSGTLGIDVSKWNGNIDWKAVKNSGVSYVIIRCGYRGSSKGALITDPKFESNIKGASAAGLKVGVYFFTQAVDEAEAVEEASMVLGQIRGYRISYPIFLDVEASGGRGDKIDKGTRTAVIRAFCRTIQDAGYTAGIYANKTWLEKRMDAGSLGEYKIWLAQYAVSPTYRGRYDLWQYQSNGRVSGISGNVDMNWSYLGY